MPIGKIATRDRAQGSDTSLPDLLTSMPLAAALVEQLAAAGRLEEFETQRQCAMLECAAELQTAIDSRQGVRHTHKRNRTAAAHVAAGIELHGSSSACQTVSCLDRFG